MTLTSSIAILIAFGLLSNGVWYVSDYATWSAWGWIAVAMIGVILAFVLPKPNN